MDLFYPTSLQQSWCISIELFEALRCSKFLLDIKQIYLITFITISICHNYQYLKNKDFVFRYNYGFWFFPLNRFTFPRFIIWIIDFPVYTETYNKKLYVIWELTIMFRWLQTKSCLVSHHVQSNSTCWNAFLK